MYKKGTNMKSEKVVIIKLLSGTLAAKENIDFAKKSLINKSTQYYNSKEGIDKTTVTEERENIKYIAILEYEKNDQRENIYKNLFVGIVCKNISNKANIRYEIKKKLVRDDVIRSFLDNIELNIDEDYPHSSYVYINSQKLFVEQVKDLVIEKKTSDPKIDYTNEHKVYELSKYAQKNTNCIREFYGSNEDIYRSEFQRDRERIVNSKAFRRLVDKAQIFSANKGIHYRTRMTHTLEVNQIAKGIGVALGLNIDLIEAIAYAHDLGHTPFGHQGERTLKKIITNNFEENFAILNAKEGDISVFGGFKHNLQTVRVLTRLEEKYVDYKGLDISYQVLEGSLKHTEIKNGDLQCFVPEKLLEFIHNAYPFSITLEGQVVAVADEIAQRGHDIDDAISSGYINLEDIRDNLNSDKFREIFDELDKIKKEIENPNRPQVDKKEIESQRIISLLIGKFIKDVIDESKTKMDNIKDEYKDNYFHKKIIDFSAKGKKLCDYLEKLINKKVINNYEVASFDINAEKIIRKLFIEYYNNPIILHEGTLRKIYLDMLEHNDIIVSSTAIDLYNGNLDIVRKEINNITKKEIDYANLSKDEEQYSYFEKRKILVRNIVDYISGMTDSYAINEYKKIM